MKILTPPTRFQLATPWSLALSHINNNYDNIQADFRGFAVEDVLAFPDNVNSIIVAAGGLGINQTQGITTGPTDDILFIVPQVSVYVDVPALSPGATEYPDDYLLPAGAALTDDQKAAIVSVVCGISASGQGEFIGSDGQLYNYANDIFVSIRNVGALDHTYYMTVSQSVYTRGNALYR